MRTRPSPFIAVSYQQSALIGQLSRPPRWIAGSRGYLRNPPSPVFGGETDRTLEVRGAGGTGVEVGSGVALGTGVDVGVAVGLGVGVGGAQLMVTSSGPTFPGWSAETVTDVGTLHDATSVSTTVSGSTDVSLSSTEVSMFTVPVPWPATAVIPLPSHLPAT
jgi:hypothetical protein